MALSRALFSFALLLAATASQQGQDDSLTLIQHTVDLNATQAATEHLQVVARAYSKVLQLHGKRVASLLQSGAAQKTDAKCSETDMDGISQALTALSSGTLQLPKSCVMKKMVSLAGINWHQYGRCIEDSHHVSPPCASCFVHMTRGVIGNVLEPGCVNDCRYIQGACSTERTRDCAYSVGQCMECARGRVDEFTQCVGFPYRQTLFQVYDDIIGTSREGTLVYPGTMDQILKDAMATLGKEPLQ
mmetsp:Transcript_13940/g.32711  ORF Transcript_13940/g.32711 Transcript_13940/m.32711 type:complete len:245 (+) Transcript_13940:64-798(+)|eukprot:CAMPEP_0171096208 /NCGR_PEP_ID=MMETSP0766_2-20121228/43876_1 /TAXON_ID=439317 /ORGANISM="Gambierdiscus australes, Strain CAWD 149" /LENGTH=244 /DNA_ID=CAMNT_0011555131 /DNA_START=61 /DNA_END=795 /DNA_ORIENTATION=+